MTIAPKVEMNHVHADAALLAFKEVADASKVDWCLFAGTALGLHRDEHFLPGDNDIDVAIKVPVANLGFFWLDLHIAGFKRGKDCENADGSRNQHFYWHPEVWWPEEGGILIDVFYKFTEEEENLLTSFDGIYYKGQLYLTPHPLELYLQTAYGEWWDPTLRNSAAGKEDGHTL